MNDIPSNLAVILAAAASLLSAYLRDANLGKWANAGISIVAFIVSSAAVIWLTTGFSGNLKDDTTLFLATAIALAGKELFVLIGYLQDAQSPLAPKYVRNFGSQEPLTRRASRTDDV